MDFLEVSRIMQENLESISIDSTHLFEVDLDKDELWNLYLESFPEEKNRIFRKKREYDCSCCRQFIKNIGNAVVIKDNKVSTIWDFQCGDSAFQPVFDTLAAFVRSKAVSNVFVSKIKKIGTKKNIELLSDGEYLTWNHLYLELPEKFVDKSRDSEGHIKGVYRDIKNVFVSSLNELTEDSVLTVLELIAQNSLYKGAEWQYALEEFLKYKKLYEKIETNTEKELFAWEQSIKAGAVVGKIRNHSIGVLLKNISNNQSLDEAVKKYEDIVAPFNYKRSKAIFTKNMLDAAKQRITDLGYWESLDRRYATLDDISINNILFANRDAGQKLMEGDVFAELEQEVTMNPKKFERVEEITIADFISRVLPTAQSLEVLLENKLAMNMVSLIAPKVKDSKSMFKWDNGFSWAYPGNMTDSLKERVKAAGGKVDGALRFSIQWNDIEHDQNDLDAHAIEPNGNEIYYGRMRNVDTTCALDIDITNPREDAAAVENITWAKLEAMQEGTYKFFVENYQYRRGRSGFRAEIEFNGEIHSFDYRKELRHKEKVPVAEVYFKRDAGFKIKELLPSTTLSREVWNLKTNQFVPVSVMMLSPNYWNEQTGIGHKHYFFMLAGCKNPENPNGFFNEFLKAELNPDRKVFEALGAKKRVEDSDNQLSGVGFSSTKRSEVIVKVSGATQRILKVKF